MSLPSGDAQACTAARPTTEVTGAVAGNGVRQATVGKEERGGEERRDVPIIGCFHSTQELGPQAGPGLVIKSISTLAPTKLKCLLSLGLIFAFNRFSSICVFNRFLNRFLNRSLSNFETDVCPRS